MISWVGNNTTATVGFDTDGGTDQGWGYYIPLGGWFPMDNLGYSGSFLVQIDACVNGGKSSNLLIAHNPTRTLPTNVGGPIGIKNVSTRVDNVRPLAPLAVPPALIGYNIYRNGGHVGANPTISDPNTLQYYDFNLNPGVYDYTVTGYYNVAPVSPLVDNSAPAGPVEVVINYGRPLPFFEPWDMGTFSFNSWYHTPGDNWSINTAFGNPAPCADFSWNNPAPLTNYSDTLRSVTLTAAPYTCAKIYLDFDYKLIDRNHTGNEYLAAEEYVDGAWVKVAEFANNGDVNWSSQHFELKATIGKAFKIQFRAHGASSLDILHWYVDNIHVYAVCASPTALTYTESHNNVTLTWTAPECAVPCTPAMYQYEVTDDDGVSINPGFNIQMGNYFPVDPAETGVLKSFDMYFCAYDPLGWTTQSCILYVYDAAYNLIGQSDPFMNGPAPQWPSGIWMNVPVNDIPYTGPFYALVDYNVASAPSKNGLTMDMTTPQVISDGLAWCNYDGTFASAASTFGYTPPNTWWQHANVCITAGGKKDAHITTLDPSKMQIGKNVRPVPGAAVKILSGKANITGVSQPPAPKAPNATSSAPAGYNVWRTDSTGMGTYYKRNSILVPTTTYSDHIALTGWGIYNYYVTAVFNDTVSNTFLCESPGSDTVTVTFPAVGIQEIGNDQISVYPNPANDVVNIVSTNDIKTIEVLNYIGQMVYANNSVSLKKVELNVSNFKSGVYFVKITTNSGIKTTKVTVTH
jgi:hypothetical protein